MQHKTWCPSKQPDVVQITCLPVIHNEHSSLIVTNLALNLLRRLQSNGGDVVGKNNAWVIWVEMVDIDVKSLLIEHHRCVGGREVSRIRSAHLLPEGSPNPNQTKTQCLFGSHISCSQNLENLTSGITDCFWKTQITDQLHR